MPATWRRCAASTAGRLGRRGCSTRSRGPRIWICVLAGCAPGTSSGFDPAGYRRWRDLGLRGHDLDGRPDPRWRGRNDQRDAAFADGLYGSGLRLAEWASVLLVELPEDDPARGYTTSYLADACAKGGYGHRYWLPRTDTVSV